ncbi:alpha-N-acetylgalactosaminide alpha-2,6-sialyltransferase 3 isoform X2 [Osmerus mordax]|uniref:alpha-N-acetylgalactosaminide alpha-2,6-sialyltransferase 3 isoform X2 n=1 Tax=Osmerus mordax TaxID=8014 RepID=UPI00350EBEA4
MFSRQPHKPHLGYVSIPKQEPLKLHCDVCSIVSSSGQMLSRAAGPDIDRSSCIWRMNNAPTRGFEPDVGRRTTLRVVSHTSVPLLLQKPQLFFGQANDTVYVVWGPLRNMRTDGKGVVYNMLRQALGNYPDARIYVTTEDRMNYCDMVFKKETGKDRTEHYRKVPYHYYEAGSRDECAEYLLHESAPYGGHRFITEKTVFAKWAKKHSIKFYNPSWQLS